MAALLYKNHFIIATGYFDTNQELWIPSADVSWQSATGRDFYSMKFSVDCFRTKDRAEMFAVKAAEAWVDKRCKTISPLTKSH
jgi:hypothetical protein